MVIMQEKAWDVRGIHVDDNESYTRSQNYTIGTSLEEV